MDLRDASSQTEWPQDLDEASKLDILDSFAMDLFLTSVMPRVEAVLVENQCFDVWHDNLGRLAEDDAMAANSSSAALSQLQSFTDMDYSQGRCMAALQWVPACKGAIAVTCTLPSPVCKAQENFSILIWGFADRTHPEFILESPIEVSCFDFNCAQPALVVGGCCNGQIIVWDYNRELDAEGHRGGSPPASVKHPSVCMSSIKYSHIGKATDVRWLPSVTFSEEGATVQQVDSAVETFYIASTAVDGKVLFWDCSCVLSYQGDGNTESPWRPVSVVALRALDSDTLGLTCSCFSFADPAMSLMLLAGSLTGDIVSCSYAAAQSEEGLQPGQSRPQTSSKCHTGRIVTLQRSPFLPHIVLSAGGSDWALYQDHFLEAPLMRSPSAPVQYTCAAWSPTCPGCLASGREDGVVEFWDLLDCSHEPVISCTVTVAMVTSLCFSPPEERPKSSAKHASHKQYLAVGSSVGVLHLMEVPSYLCMPTRNELQSMQKYMQRQALVAEHMAKSMAQSPEELTKRSGELSPYSDPKVPLAPLSGEKQRIAEAEVAKLETFYRAEWGLGTGSTH